MLFVQWKWIIIANLSKRERKNEGKHKQKVLEQKQYNYVVKCESFWVINDKMVMFLLITK